MSSSLVAEFLHSAGKLTKEDISSKVDSLKRRTEDIKLEIQESLKNRYIDFLPEYVLFDKFIEELKHITEEHDIIYNQIEKEIKPQMTSSVSKLHDVMDDLNKIKKLKSVITDMALLNKHLEVANNYLLQSMYLHATENLLKFEEIFKKVDPEYQKDVEIYNALKTKCIITKIELINVLQQKWEQKLVIDSSNEGKDRKLNVALTINNLTEDDVEFLVSLKLLNNLKPLLKKFGKRFLDLICETLLLRTVKMEITNNRDVAILTIDVVNVQNPEPHVSFERLKDMFQFLCMNFFKSPLSTNDNTHLLIEELGLVIADDFCTLVLEKCLKTAVPNQSRQLGAFHSEVQAAEEFYKSLVEIRFFCNTENKLLHFIHNVDILPVNKMARDILSRARSLMKESLHQTITLGEESVDIISDNATDYNKMARIKTGLSQLTFAFPHCEISVSVKNLVNLLIEVMEEAKNVGSANSPRLYYVARNICELYCSVVPTYHKEEIEKIPQQTAIFHNNCMYLAHCLLTLGTQYNCALMIEFPTTFVDLVPEIRKLAVEAFLAQMRNQRQQLLQLLQEQQAFQGVAIDVSIINKAEKAVRQCLCQLHLLKRVWSDVLPTEVYFKSIGTLFNTCLEEIIIHVLAMEDIAAETAAQLDSIFGLLLNQGPDLFKITSVDKSDSAYNYVRRWFKFQELQLVLSTSMKEILDRWASGKGPLASYFTADEVKHLIRALFQNTERRAAALAKIR